MADTKISALAASTTPLAGTEVLPIVQNSTTKQVSVANLTAGRAISATAVTATTGNFVVGTSGQGIDFSATSGTGTSELLNDYEEGDWTPVTTVAGATYTAQTGRYTKIGRQVTVLFNIAWSAHTGAGSDLLFGGLPYAASSAVLYPPGQLAISTALPAGRNVLVGYIAPGSSEIAVLGHDSTAVLADAFVLIGATGNHTVSYVYFV